MRNWIKRSEAIYLILVFLTGLVWLGNGSLSADDLSSKKEHIVAELACQKPPEDIDGEFIDPLHPIYRDYFSPKETVWIAVKRKRFGDKKKARVYVFSHGTNWEYKKKLKGDVSGGHESVDISHSNEEVIYTEVWIGPTICEKGYDVVVDFPPLGIYNKGEDIVDGISQKGFLVPKLWLCLESISFNHDEDCSDCDAINIRKNLSTPIIPPEWNNGQSSPAAYIKERYVTIKAIVTANTDVKTARVRAVRTKGDFGNLEEKLVRFRDGRSCPVYFDIPNKTTGEVKAFVQEWEWHCWDINGSYSNGKHIGTSKNRIYVILAEPQVLPWGIEGELKPWADALEYACKWAEGARNEPSAAEEITCALYNDVGGFYNQEGSSYTNNSFNIKKFDLEEFVKMIKTHKFGVAEVSCLDMGKALVTFSNVIGCKLTYHCDGTFGDYLYCIQLIGFKNHCCASFGKHAYGMLYGKVFDATLKLCNRSGCEEWVSNFDLEEYKSRVVKDWTLPHQETNSKHDFYILGKEEKKFSSFTRKAHTLFMDFLDISSGEKVIPGIRIDNDFFNCKIGLDLDNFDLCKYYSIERFLDDSYSSVIRKVWRRDNDILDIRMTVAPKSYTKKTNNILEFFQNHLPSFIYKRAISPNNLSEDFSDYPPPERDNVKIRVKTYGTIYDRRNDIKRVLQKELDNQGEVDDLSQLENMMPKIRCFTPVKLVKKNKKQVFIKLKVDSREGGWYPIWKVYKGKIEKDADDDYLYTGEYPGKNNVKVIVMNDRGLFVQSGIVVIETK